MTARYWGVRKEERVQDFLPETAVASWHISARASFGNLWYFGFLKCCNWHTTGLILYFSCWRTNSCNCRRPNLKLKKKSRERRARWQREGKEGHTYTANIIVSHADYHGLSLVTGIWIFYWDCSGHNSLMLFYLFPLLSLLIFLFKYFVNSVGVTLRCLIISLIRTFPVVKHTT